MTQAELDLLLALYLLYAYECVFWLGPDEQAFTRSSPGPSGGGWRPHRLTAQSFTLLNRRPVLADPLLLRPGFVREPAMPEPARPTPAEHARTRVAQDLGDFTLLTTQCRLQAVLLLLVLPALLVTHRLSPWWREYTGILLFNHALLCWWLFRALACVPPSLRSKLLTPALLNPLGATRVLDPLAQALYDRQVPKA